MVLVVSQHIQRKQDVFPSSSQDCQPAIVSEQLAVTYGEHNLPSHLSLSLQHTHAGRDL